MLDKRGAAGVITFFALTYYDMFHALLVFCAKMKCLTVLNFKLCGLSRRRLCHSLSNIWALIATSYQHVCYLVTSV